MLWGLAPVVDVGYAWTMMIYSHFVIVYLYHLFWEISWLNWFIFKDFDKLDEDSSFDYYFIQVLTLVFKGNLGFQEALSVLRQ